MQITNIVKNFLKLMVFGGLITKNAFGAIEDNLDFNK